MKGSDYFFRVIYLKTNMYIYIYIYIYKGPVKNLVEIELLFRENRSKACVKHVLKENKKKKQKKKKKKKKRQTHALTTWFRVNSHSRQLVLKSSFGQFVLIDLVIWSIRTHCSVNSYAFW